MLDELILSKITYFYEPVNNEQDRIGEALNLLINEDDIYEQAD